MPNFRELEQPSDEARRQFVSGFNTIEHATNLHRAYADAQRVVDTLRNAVNLAQDRVDAPEGHIFNVMPDRRTGGLTIGEYYTPYQAHGIGHMIVNPVETDDGEPFVGDSLIAVSGRMIVVNNETKRGCEVPQPPLLHIEISPVAEQVQNP